MTEQLTLAKNTLQAENYTCVLYSPEALLFSRERGVKPLLQWLEEERDYSGFCAADRVVGKAAAFLYLLMGVRAVWAGILSEPARQVFLAHGVTVEYEKLVPAIRNRTDTGFCPMETAVWNIEDPWSAPEVIRAKLKELSGK